MNSRKYYRIYREGTNKTVGILSRFDKSQVDKICFDVNNNCKLVAEKLDYEFSNFLEFENYRAEVNREIRMN